MPNCVKPADIMEMVVNAGTMKSNLPIADLIVRAWYSGFMLGCASSMNAALNAQTGLSMIGALFFPCGFAMIVFYGFELVTGNMMAIPVAIYARKAKFIGLVKNWTTVYTMNWLGCLFYMAWFIPGLTYFGKYPSGGTTGAMIVTIAKNKTIAYKNYGFEGWWANWFKSVLCNTLVSFAIFGSIASTSATGKLVVAWIPVIMFAFLGFEHVVVNMFMVAAAMWINTGGITMGDYWGWSIAPSTTGNLFGSLIFVSIPMWFTWGHEYRKKQKLEAKLDAAEDIASPTTPYPEPAFPAEPEPVFPVNANEPLVNTTPYDRASEQGNPRFY